MNRVTRHLLVGSLCTILPSCALVPVESAGSVTPTQLNANKTAYHGQKVLVRGWMRSAFENYGLWLDQAAEKRGHFASDCISLMIPKPMDSGSFDQRYVEIEGVFLKRYPENVFVSGGCNLSALELIEGKPPRVVRASVH